MAIMDTDVGSTNLMQETWLKWEIVNFLIFIFQQINLHFTLCSVACFLRVLVQCVHQNAMKSANQKYLLL